MKIAQRNLNVFQGEDAIKRFLNPENNPPIPLVELPESLNPFRKDGVRIFAKLMNQTALGNVKALPALNMLLEAEASGQLKNVESLIENSSGNTVFSLAVLGRLFGIQKTRAIVSHEVSWGKLQLLRFFGTEVIVNEEPICPNPSDRTSGIYKAKELGKREGWLNPGQYDNEANPRAHEQWTAPQIWEQTGGKICIFCAGLGTTGTITGISRFLKKKSKKVFTLGVARSLNNPVPGVRTKNLLREIAFDWQSVVDEVVQIGTKESFETSLGLCRHGLVVGPSSGFCLAGLISLLEERKRDGSLEDLKNSNGEIVAVFICPDSPLPYIEEYFEYLEASHFPSIRNENLLICEKHSRNLKTKKINKEKAERFDLSPEQVFEMIYSISPEKVWQKLELEDSVPLKKNVVIIDVRSAGEFSHFHISGARQLNTHKLSQRLSHWKSKKVILCCSMGLRTREIARFLREKGVEAYSLEGGMTEWSARNLPRVRPAVCNA